MIRSRDVRNRAKQVIAMFNVTGPPVEVNEIARHLGFTVIPFEFPDEVSGVTFIEAGVKSIGVNSKHALTRQRFSVAHEIGHYLCGHEAYDGDKILVEETARMLNAHSHQEMEANEFAAELLMPVNWLRKDVGAIGLDVPALAKRYQVSEQAMWIQLIDHRLASQHGR